MSGEVDRALRRNGARRQCGRTARRVHRSAQDIGYLAGLHQELRQRRLAAKARGEGFMPFAAAELRFKRALIPLLQSGGQPAIGQSLFATIFNT